MLLRLWRDGVRGEAEKGVGSIPAIRCNVGKAGRNQVYWRGCMWICGSDDHKKVIATKERAKRTMKSFNTSFNIRSPRSSHRLGSFAIYRFVVQSQAQKEKKHLPNLPRPPIPRPTLAAQPLPLSLTSSSSPHRLFSSFPTFPSSSYPHVHIPYSVT